MLCVVGIEKDELMVKVDVLNSAGDVQKRWQGEHARCQVRSEDMVMDGACGR